MSDERIVEEYNLNDVRIKVLSSGEYSISISPPSPRASKILKIIPFYFDPSEIADEKRRERNISSLAKRLSLSESDVEWLRAKLSGYDVLYPLMRDPKVTDIWVKSDRQLLVRHQEYGDLTVTLNGRPLILSKGEVHNLALRLASKAGVAINLKNPTIEGARLGKDRVTISILGEPYVIIRKFPRHPWTLHKLVARRMLTAKAAALLWLFNEAKIPIMIYGPMGSGKTSLAGAIIATAKPKATLIIIQDMPEINIAHPYAHYLYPTPAVGYSKLLSLALRTGSEYLIMGEVRNEEEARTFVQAIKTGHGGVTTIHAKEVQDIISRLKHFGLSSADITSVKVFVKTGMFESKAKGIRTYIRRVLSVELVEGVGDDFSITKVIEYDQVSDSWLERLEPEIFDLLCNSMFVREAVIRSRLELREKWLTLLANRYERGRFIETAEDWYASLEVFYSEEDSLLRIINEPEKLATGLVQLVARVEARRWET